MSDDCPYCAPDEKCALHLNTPYSTERVQINAEVDTEDRDRLKETAKANDRSFAAELRRAIRFYLEHGQ